MSTIITQESYFRVMKGTCYPRAARAVGSLAHYAARAEISERPRVIRDETGKLDKG